MARHPSSSLPPYRGWCRDAHDPWLGSPCISAGLPNRRPGWHSTSRPNTREVRPLRLQICQISSASASSFMRSRTASWRDMRRSRPPGAGRSHRPSPTNAPSLDRGIEDTSIDRRRFPRVASAHRAAARRNCQALPDQTVHWRAKSTATCSLAEWLQACRTGRRADRRRTIALEPDDVKGPKGGYASVCGPAPFSEMDSVNVHQHERPKVRCEVRRLPVAVTELTAKWWNRGACRLSDLELSPSPTAPGMSR